MELFGVDVGGVLKGSVRFVKKNPFMAAAAAYSLWTGNPAAVMALSQAATAAGATTYAIGAATGSNNLKSAGAYVCNAGVQGMVGSAGAGAARGAWASSDGFMSRLSGAWEGAKGTFVDGSRIFQSYLPGGGFEGSAQNRELQSQFASQVAENTDIQDAGYAVNKVSGVNRVTYKGAPIQQIPLNQAYVDQELAAAYDPTRGVYGSPTPNLHPSVAQATPAAAAAAITATDPSVAGKAVAPAAAAAAPAAAVPSGFLNKALHYAPLLNMAGDAIGGAALGAYGAEDAERKFELAKEKHELEMELYRQRIENWNAPVARYGGPTRRSPRFRPQAQQRRQQQAEALKAAQERPQRQRLMPPAGRSFS